MHSWAGFLPGTANSSPPGIEVGNHQRRRQQPQTNGNQVLKSQTLAWLSPGMGEVASTCLPWPRGLHKSQLCAPKAATLLLQSLGLCTPASSPPKSSHPKAARQTLEHPGSHPGPLLSRGSWAPLGAGRVQRHTQSPAWLHEDAEVVESGLCAPRQPQNHHISAVSQGLG